MAESEWTRVMSLQGIVTRDVLQLSTAKQRLKAVIFDACQHDVQEAMFILL